MIVYWDTTIKELWENNVISVRTYNRLRIAGLRTLEEILNFVDSPIELLKLRGFGRKSCTEMEPLFREYELKKISQRPMIPQTSESVLAILDSTIAAILKEAYETLFVEDNRVTNFFKSCYPSVADLHKNVTCNETTFPKINIEFTIAENIEIRKMYARYLDESLCRMWDEHNADNDTYTKYKKTLEVLFPYIETFSYKEKVEQLISPKLRDFLQKMYEEMCEKYLSVRGRKFVRIYAPRFEVLATLFNAPIQDYKILCRNRQMTKTLDEVFFLNTQLKAQFDHYWQMNDRDLLKEQQRRDYPFLNSAETAFLLKHQEEFGFPPLFFLLYIYLCRSEERSNRLYSLRYGIIDGKERTLNELTDLCLTRERIRQIISNKLEVHKTELIQSVAWQKYDKLFALPFITQESEEYLVLKEREHLPFDFRVFARLIQLIREYKIVSENNVTIAINHKVMPSINLGEILESLRLQVFSRYSNETPIEICTSMGEVSVKEKKIACEVVAYIAKKSWGLNVVDNQTILVQKNYIDISKELYDILAQKGETMSIHEIFDAFKQKYPNHKYTKAGQICKYLYQHPNIKPIGKTSRYGLEKWDGVYFGTIRQLLIDLMRASDNPIHIEQLYKAVIEYYPNTNIKSIVATMTGALSCKIRQFCDGYFGLVDKEYEKTYVEKRQSICDSVLRSVLQIFVCLLKNTNVILYHQIMSVRLHSVAGCTMRRTES